MSELVQKVISKLTDPKDTDELNEALIYAGDIFSSYKMKGFTSCIFPEIDEERYSDEDIEDIKAVLLKKLEEMPHSSFAGSILGVLGKLSDSSLKQLFINYLMIYVRESIKYDSNLNSVTIALSYIGEDIITGGSQGVYDFDKNMKQAMDYLKRIEKFEVIFEEWDSLS